MPYRIWNKLKDNFERLRVPELDWIQIEVSSYCDASCIYCPHTVYRKIWQDHHMPLPAFRRLLSALSGINLVFLQGWGEPFLNPDFFEMVRLAKGAGCMVGTTTNGMSLDDDKIKQIVESGMDIMAFSLAGVDEGNDSIRRGTRFKTIMNAIETIDREKARMGASKPSINIAYMLLRSGIKDLPKIPSVFSGSRISQVVISTLDFIPDKELAAEALLPADEAEFEHLSAILDQVVADAKSLNLDVYYNLYNPSKRRQACTENVQNSLFISSDGTVSPCVFTNLPIIESLLPGNNLFSAYRRLGFGNVNEYTLSSIWSQKAYKLFRNAFNSENPPDVCLKCPKLYIAQSIQNEKEIQI